jgi:hypothetical protein
VVLVGLLDQKSDTTLLAGDDADSLLPSCQFHYSTIVRIPTRDFVACVRSRSVGFGQTYLVGDLALILLQVSQLLPNFDTTSRTLRLYLFLRFKGSRENCTPFALLTSVALCPSAHNQRQILMLPSSRAITHW